MKKSSDDDTDCVCAQAPKLKAPELKRNVTAKVTEKIAEEDYMCSSSSSSSSMSSSSSKVDEKETKKSKSAVLSKQLSSARFMRQNVLTGKWCLYMHGGFKGKPSQMKRSNSGGKKRIEDEPRSVDKCPFCCDASKSDPDTTRSRPGDILRFDKKTKKWIADWSPETGSWSVRVVRNIFPVISQCKNYYHDGYKSGYPEDNSKPFDEPYKQIPSLGHSEVIVEYPYHNVTHAIASVEEVKLTIEAMLMRGKALRKSECARYVTFFKQHKCGSLVHAHSQLITTPFVPSNIRRQCVRAKVYYEKHKECAACRVRIRDPLSNEEAKKRKVFHTKHFVVSVPYAATESKEMVIAPRRHSCDFLNMNDEEIVDFAACLRHCSGLYYYYLNDHAWNLGIITCPLRYESDEERAEYEKYFHWHATIRPKRRHAPASGFSDASDIADNPYLPEDDAGLLRKWYNELLLARQSSG